MAKDVRDDVMRTIGDVGVAALGGLLATQIMSITTTRLVAMQSAADRAREQAVSPGIAYEVAARRTSHLVGADPSDVQVSAAGAAIHYLLGAGWAVVYLVLRRGLSWHPIAAALGTGMSLELIVDEGANAALGFSARPQDYPISTHLRGVVGHAVYGLVVAAVMELAWSVTRRD